MPVYFICVGRLRDHLILTSTVDDESSISSLKNEAKSTYMQLSVNSQPRLTYSLLTTRLHICVSNPIFAFCVADREFEPQLAYAMLERVLHAFNNEYGEAVEAVEREYVFLDFHTTLDSIRFEYHKKVTDSNLGKVERELNTVKSEMAANIKAALIRQEKLGQVEDLSEQLGHSAGVFAKESRDLNRLHFWRTYGRPAVVVGIVSIVYFLVGFFIV
jgi:hypothetical protein